MIQKTNFDFKNINIDWLKSNHSMIHFFGLGFIQIKLKDPKFRVHFYSIKYSPIVSDKSIHNHRYSFSSFIIKGCLRQKIFDFTPDQNGAYIKKYESCSKEQKCNLPAVLGNVKFKLFTTHEINNFYTIADDTLHKIIAEEDSISFIERTDYQKEFAEIINLIGEEDICPFSLEINEKELWEVVNEMLKM